MLNTCVLAGNLGNDPEIRYTNDGKSIANFDMAFSSGKDRTMASIHQGRVPPQKNAALAG